VTAISRFPQEIMIYCDNASHIVGFLKGKEPRREKCGSTYSSAIV
jgi:hypothetical protein